MAKSQIEEVMDIQRTLEDSVAKRMAEFESRFMASAVAPEITVKKLHQEYLSFKEFVMNIFNLCQQQISLLTNSVDAIDMRSRRQVLLVAGICESKEEHLSDIISQLISSTMNIDVTPHNLQMCHRLGKIGDRPRPVLVRFQSLHLRDTVWQKKAMFKGTPHTVSEFLTRSRHEVFLNARRHFGMKRCWTMDGIINIKLPSGVRVKLSTKAELQDLMNKFPAVPGKSEEVMHTAVVSQQKRSGSSAANIASDRKIVATRKHTQAQKSK